MDEITVRWDTSLTRTLKNYGVDESWTLFPPERLGDADGDGDVDMQDLAAFWSCWTASGPGSLRPGCEVMDLDGDGDVDGEDALLLYRLLELTPARVPSKG